MEVIYADSLFILNFAIDYLLLLCSARVCGCGLHRLRYALAAALGGVYAVASVLPQLAFLRQPLIKLASAGFMALVAFGGESRLLRCGLVFLSVSAAFGGAVWAIGLAAGGGNGRLYIPLDFKTLLLSFAVCYFLISLVFHRAGRRAEAIVLPLEISLLGRSVKLTALRDTGNGLFDPMSEKKVILAEAAALSPLFPGQELCGAAAEVMARLSGVEALRQRLRLIPFDSVGGGGLLAAFQADEVRIDGAPAADLLIAISPRALSRGDGVSALI